MLYPRTCVSCGAAGTAVCPSCAARFASVGRIHPTPTSLDAGWALVGYDETARAVVTALKHRRDRSLVDALVPGMVALVPERVRASAPVVTWAPTSPHRRRRRGYDQAELLARGVARRLGLRAHRLLRRGDGTPQAGLAAAERRRPLPIVARGRAPASVLVVDDVCTTGATLDSCGEALRAAGAHRVVGLVVAYAVRHPADSRSSSGVGGPITTARADGGTTEPC